jgi:hypothetical protein
MSLAAVVPRETTFRDAVDDAIQHRIIDSSEFVGRRVRIDGGNYVLETVISAVLIALEYQTEKELRQERPSIKNIRLSLKDSVVSVDKKRYRMTRTIDHLSYAACGTNHSDSKVVFKEDGLETIKAASMVFLD